MDGRLELIENQRRWLIYNRAFFTIIKDRIRVESTYSYQDFKENMQAICHLSFRIFYIFYGILQFLATWVGLVKVFHQDNLIIQLVSAALGFLPLIGTFSGLYGAHIGWGWDLSYSLFVFIIPYFIVNGPILLIAMIDIYKDSRRWKLEKEQSEITH